MFKYQGVSCPCCGKEFKEDDQILICPECGAPYHRDCIQKLGKCMFDELHAKHESWQPPQKAPHEEDEQKYDSRASMRCSRCGTVNSPDRLFCEVCGTPLNRNENQQEKPSSPGQQPFRQMAYNPYTTPFGGLSPDEEVEEIPVKDLALYVGQNTHYFLPKFKEMSTRKKSASWNWPAFFLDFYYLFYRKMWLAGTVTAILSLLLSVPSLIIVYNAFFYQLGLTMPASAETMRLLDTLGSFCYIGSLILKLAVSVFTNRLYKDKVFRDIKKLRAEKKDDPQYSTLLTAKGGVSIKAAVICVVLTMAISFFCSFVMVGAVMKMY